jgi:heme-degrading monooxygenase HmoA
VGRDGSAVGTLPRAEEFAVYARTTTIQADPARVDDGVRMVRDDVFPAVTSMDGCVGMSMFVNRESGRCIATTAWESEEAIRASADRVRPLRDAVAEAMGSGGVDVHEWEVAVVHRDHAVPDGACARIAWLSGDPATAERAPDTFRMHVLPRVQELAGFCSASVLVNREAGRWVGTTIFDSREAIDASREAATRRREEATRELGATVDMVEEMEVAFAHLHVPEMV